MTAFDPARLHQPIKMAEIELSQPIPTIENLSGYCALKALIRLHGSPLGYVQLGVKNDRCTARDISKAILSQHRWGILRHLLLDGLAALPKPGGLRLADLIDLAHPDFLGPFQPVTVAVCTRDRPQDLEICLNALSRLTYPDLEILVVDNAPSTDATQRLVESRFPCVRYVQEPRPGLSRARNRAIAEARGEIIAFTDDDVIVDPGWVNAIVQTFVENPEASALTGLVVPFELETEPQILFERSGGFTRGFERRRYQVRLDGEDRWADHHGAGKFGSGANMAFRLNLFKRLGHFDPALGVGTSTGGGEDLEFFFRLLHAGYLLIYEPDALVWHRHRREYPNLRRQMTNTGIGVAAFHARSMRAYPDQAFRFLLLHLNWLWNRQILRLLQSLTRPNRFPRDLILAEFWGFLTGFNRYRQAQALSIRIERQFEDRIALPQEMEKSGSV